MNKFKRTKIKKVIEEMHKIIMQLNNIKTAEENDFDNMPENLQNSINGNKSEEAIDILEEAIENLEETCGMLNEI